MIRYEKDTDNNVTLKLDMGDRAINVLNHEIGKAFIRVLEQLNRDKAEGKLNGIIITSAKKSFIYGGDLGYLKSSTTEEIFEYSRGLQDFFRALEQPGVSVVAAINGTALGSGFEMALACHHRIAIDNNDIGLGFPEVTLGLMPGSGGIVRTLWMLGIEKAYDVLTADRPFTPKEALKTGLIDDLAIHEDDMLAKAKKWLLVNKGVRQPWDCEDGKIPYGTMINNVDLAKSLTKLTAANFKKYRGNYPAPQAILNTLSEASKVDFNTACIIESRKFTGLVTSRNSMNMTKVFWFDAGRINNNQSRPKGYGKFRPRKIGIIGSGTMGSGIAYCCILNGIEVVLKDVSKAVAERGRKQIVEKLAEEVAQKNIRLEDKEKAETILKTTEDAKDFQDCDLVIEAVFENKNLKEKVSREAGQYMDEYSFFASNTSMLSITDLATSFSKPDNYVGLHFFAPVSERRLVEIVKGATTSDETVARAFDFVKRIGKMPIIVKDNPGFYSSRVQNVFLLEGIDMLQRGYPPAIIENVSLMAGMPQGPLAMADALSLNWVLQAERRAAEIYGQKYIIHPAVEALQKMKEVERTGTFKGAGFYNYEDGERTSIWEGLQELFPVKEQDEYDIEYLKERIYFAQILEAVWCYQEGIVDSVAEANIGSVYGWGFPAFKGGVLQFVDDYGVEEFIAKAKEFEEVEGPRFIVPKILRQMGEDGVVFA